ncbi:hypothetical protein C0Q70_20437 [Pomacea canaliculata]|uniref:Ig-like domain-containing protein n=1 Tax=Pomacea canaliculata TaxID=400727 RepID=A0A2T7NFI4_POMCA|nr:hypothetical protein C0Q70_20437 [Pomacea canaliculata]
MIKTRANPQTDAGTYTCLAGHESADVTIEFLSRAEVKSHTVTSVTPVEPQYKEGVAYDVGYNVTNQVVYVSGNWSACSVTCGAGHQTRHVTCTRITYRYLKHLPDSECEKTGLVKPRETQECSQQPDCPQWSLGNWEKCSLNTCVMDGFAERRRPVMCMYTNGSLAPSGACDNKHRPESARRCVNIDCVSQWTTTAWTACQPSCGEKGIRARMLMCTWQRTGLPAWTACKHKERPPASEVCKPRPCPAISMEECRDKSRYCSLAVMLRMCRVEDFRTL